MKKINKIGKFESELDEESNIDVIDIQAIIKDKIVRNVEENKANNQHDSTNPGLNLSNQDPEDPANNVN